MFKKNGKILLITGTSIIDQINISNHLVNNLEFIKLNQEKIFNKITLEISDEYFIKDIKFVFEITGKLYQSYLDLLNFLQKTSIAKLEKIYLSVYRKAQLANEIIIFRLYKEYFKEVKEITSDKQKTTIIHCDKPTKNDVHPTMKPIKLLAPLIENSSKVGQLVADGFLGSGSTMVASHQLKRKCYGIELDPKYCQVIVDRMKKLDPALIIKKNGVTL